VHGAGGSSAIWFKQIRPFRKKFNVLMPDLRGHGRSVVHDKIKEKYTLASVSSEILDVLDHLKIESAHFVGISLGTLLIREILDDHPNRVRTLVMAGAITNFTLWARFLIAAGNSLKYVIPFKALYATFAWIIMPGKRASEARILFRREARQVSPPEFRRWLRLTAEIKNKLPYWRKSGGTRPVLYAMGGHDYMFLPSAKLLADVHENVSLLVISESGHVCNVERPDDFNQGTFSFFERYRERETV